MSSKINFSETKNWEKVVTETYRLKTKNLVLGGRSIIFYDNGSFLANSAYITEGGDFCFEKTIEKNDLENIQRPILIKTSQQFEVSKEIEYCVDQTYFDYILDLSKGKDFVWKNLVKSKTRNQVRKAEKTHYEVKFGRDELLDDFYTIISIAWRDLGTPTHSKDFYKNIIKNFDAKSETIAGITVIYINNKPVSAAFLLYDKNTIYHPYAATLKDFNKYSINNALYWEIILWATEKKISHFDMGRSKREQGTSKYKMSWGAKEIQLYYYYLNLTTIKNVEEKNWVKFAINCWKLLPLSIANFLGPKLIYTVLK